MENVIDRIHKELGITSHHLKSNKLEFHPQPPLDQLVVVDIDFDGRPFVLHSKAAKAWQLMRASAVSDEIYFQPFSGFRSYLHQKKLIENSLRAGRDLEAILSQVAIPGFCEHHSGCAIDIYANGNPILEEAFENSEEFLWLNKNASGFGFRLSYPRSNEVGIVYEPWHWYFTSVAI